MNLKNKLVLSFLTVIFVAILALCISSFSVYRIYGKYKYVTKEVSSVKHNFLHIEESLHAMIVSMEHIKKGRFDKGNKILAKANIKFQENMDEAKAIINKDVNLSQIIPVSRIKDLEKIKKRIFIDSENFAINNKNAASEKGKLSFEIKESLLSITECLIIIRDLRKSLYVLIQHLDKAVMKSLRFDFMFIIFLGVFCILLSMVLSLYMAESIARPIRDMTKMTSQVGEGSFSVKVKVSSNDEIGTLATNFNNMITRLHDTTASIDVLNKEILRRKEAERELIKKEKATQDMLTGLNKANTALKDMQNQLIQSEKMASIGQLAAGVAHEINNPIGFVASNMQTLDGYITSFMKLFRIVDTLKKSIENEDIEKTKSTIEEMKILEEEENIDLIANDINDLIDQSNVGLERVKKIILDLRIFAREDNDEKVDIVFIHNIVEGSLNIIQNEIKYNCTVEKDYGQLPAIKCHSQKISQVLINLIVNAAHSFQDKGKIIIKTYLKDEYACIDIEDNGCGIPQEKIKKIFDPFFTTKEIGKGTGLGLSISYDIVKLHGGDILVESKVGQGTKMTVMLPLTQEDP